MGRVGSGGVRGVKGGAATLKNILGASGEEEDPSAPAGTPARSGLACLCHSLQRLQSEQIHIRWLLGGGAAVIRTERYRQTEVDGKVAGNDKRF